MSAKIETVLGAVEVSQLKGAILPHEHILVDFRRGLVPPPPGLEWLPDTPLCLEHLGKIRQYPYSVRQNLVMNRVDEMEQELSFFKQAGGGTICELSVTGIRCHPHQPEQLAELARKTGLNIIHGTGFYCHQFLPSNVHSMSVREMQDFMLDEIQVGIGQSKIRCGVIYIGCSWPLHETEQRALKAAAAVQKQTGTPITIHPGRSDESPFQILDILQAEGADLSRICIPHLCRTFSTHSKFLELAKRGCYINISLFSKECSHYPYAAHLDIPSDAQRLSMVNALLQSGYKDKILVSQDVVCKHELRRYGGEGYAHLLEHIAPKMEERGICKDTVNTIFTENPKTWLTPIPFGRK